MGVLRYVGSRHLSPTFGMGPWGCPNVWRDVCCGLVGWIDRLDGGRLYRRVVVPPCTLSPGSFGVVADQPLRHGGFCCLSPGVDSWAMVYGRGGAADSFVCA